MIIGFAKYLIDNGYKRYRHGVEDYISTNISTYGPIEYRFAKGDNFVYWGLAEKGLPPHYHFSWNKMYVNKPNKGDGFIILFQHWGRDKYPDILRVIESENLYFQITVNDTDIDIEIKSR